MRFKCMICDEEFENEELLKKHVEEHLSESILNQPRKESVNTDYSFEDKNPELDIKKYNYLITKIETIITDLVIKEIINNIIDSIDE